ncbi:MAG: DinB family protein [Chloroflexota bacterium]
MKELIAYRSRMLDRLLELAEEFRKACKAVKDPFAAVDVGGWNTHQLAAHTRDVDRHVYGMRTRRTISEENPLFNTFDADSWMGAHYGSSEPLAGILDELTTSIKELVEKLRNLPPGAWARESRHETLGGGFTTQIWVERGLAHIEEHLASVKKAL